MAENCWERGGVEEWSELSAARRVQPGPVCGGTASGVREPGSALPPPLAVLAKVLACVSLNFLIYKMGILHRVLLGN